MAVVAFGGNALVTDAEHDSIPQQYETVCRTVPPLLDLVEQGWGLVVSHGNGPQVGFILRRSELAKDEVDPVPVDYAVADTQGAIGYMFVKALRNELTRRGLNRPGRRGGHPVRGRTSTIPHSRIRPSRSVRSCPRTTAKKMAAELGWTIVEDAGRGWRRTVPSPRPDRNRGDRHRSGSCWTAGAIVVAAGGGGIPVVVESDGTVVGVEAVVDKDLASGLLAHELGADLLLIPTAVPRVAIRFGTPDQQWLDTLTVEQARAYIDAGEFGEGSHGTEGRRRRRLRREDPGRGRRDRRRRGHRGRSWPARPARASWPTCRPRPSDPAIETPADAVLLAVNGTLMRGLKLNPNMVDAGATFVREADHRTGVPAVDDRRRPPRDGPGDRRLGRRGGRRGVVGSARGTGRGSCSTEPAGLSIGKVRLDDGSVVLGVIGEPALVEGHRGDHRLRRMAGVRRRAGATVVTVLGRQLLPDAPAGTMPV